MAYSSSSPRQGLTSAKIVVAGGFGVGKTTFVGAVSEIKPLNTDAWMTQASAGVDSLDGAEHKTKTTVAMDFGKITLAGDLVLYLFGTPGQPRFWRMWDDLTNGASAAIVLLDSRRLDASFPAMDYFEYESDVPSIGVLNCFHGEQTHDLAEISQALRLDPQRVPLLACDARDRTSVTQTLVAAVQHSMRRAAELALR